MATASHQFRLLKKRFKTLFLHPFFWMLTAVGNFIILVGSFLLWYFEGHLHQAPFSLLDCLLWSAGTVTTVGSDLNPQTIPGKLTVLVLMLGGTVFVWSYMAFLVTGLIAPELPALERDVHNLKQTTHDAILAPPAIKENK